MTGSRGIKKKEPDDDDEYIPTRTGRSGREYRREDELPARRKRVVETVRRDFSAGYSVSLLDLLPLTSTLTLPEEEAAARKTRRCQQPFPAPIAICKHSFPRPSFS